MTIAELHGKISSSGRNLHEKLEDLLTSNVFGTCKYLRPETLLLPFLRTSVSIDGVGLERYLPDIVKDVKYKFWPRLKSSEPDLLITIRDDQDGIHIVMVEAKYLSGKSSDALESEEIEFATAPSDQLAREYDDLVNIEKSFNLPPGQMRQRFLVYITAHRNLPEAPLTESMDEVEHFYPDLDAGPIFWTSWFYLLSKLTFNNEILEWEKPILDDLLDLLQKKRFAPFVGYKQIEELHSMGREAFYRKSGRVKSGQYNFKLVPLEPIVDFSFSQEAHSGIGYGWLVPKAQDLPSIYH